MLTCKKQHPDIQQRMPLRSLGTQAVFEELWFHKDLKTPLAGMRPSDCAWIQYHTAKWCGPCKRLDIPAIVAAAEARGLTVWKIDVDDNEYTSGYCGVRSIPTFQMCVPKSIRSTFQPANTEAVIEWISKNA